MAAVELRAARCRLRVRSVARRDQGAASPWRSRARPAAVYLTLAGQHESLTPPFIILLSVPLAIMGALAQWGCGLIDDVYRQIGPGCRIGLSAKNGILVVSSRAAGGRGLSIADARSRRGSGCGRS
jgi:multidrug efflux pump subunit AcrB